MNTLLASMLMASCAEEQPVQYTDEDTASETTSTTTLKRRTFTYPIKITDAESGLTLAANAHSIFHRPDRLRLDTYRDGH